MTHTRSFGLFGLALGLFLGLATACHDQSAAIGAGWFGLGNGCDEIDCGGNSAWTTTYQVGEGHKAPNANNGEPNFEGVQLIDFVPPVFGDFVVSFTGGAITASDGTGTLVGSELIGSKLVFRDEAGTVEEIVIYDHDTELSWTNGAVVDIPRYLFSYAPGNGSERPLCSLADSFADEAAWAVLITNERYDGAAKTVSATGAEADGWFNIACQGNALYKMKMMGYDPEPNPVLSFTTTSEQRQTAIKMFTADYCGTGTSYTEVGHSLMWTDRESNTDNHWLYGSPTSNEGAWVASRALCLDIPRLSTSGADLESLLEEITLECESVGVALPRCSDVDVGEAMWFSANPY